MWERTKNAIGLLLFCGGIMLAIVTLSYPAAFWAAGMNAIGGFMIGKAIRKKNTEMTLEYYDKCVGTVAALVGILPLIASLF